MLPRYVAQVFDGVGPLEIARVDDAHRQKHHVLEFARSKPQGIEHGVDAQAAVTADQDRGRRAAVGSGSPAGVPGGETS